MTQGKNRFFKAQLGKNPNTEMTFLDHLESLRWHLIRSVAAIFIFTIIAFLYKEILFDVVIFGPRHSDFFTYRALCYLGDKLGADLCIKEVSFSIINTLLSGQFLLHMWVAFIAGFIISFPYVLWELWRFIKPALHMKEKQYTRGIVFFSSVLFLSGVLFGYYIITPMSVNFLGSYKVSDEVNNLISMDSYISTVAMLALSSGIIFELPIVIYFLSKMGIVTPAFMRTYRKHAIVIILIAAAIITPTPDVTGQVLVAIPLYLLYEASIIVSAVVIRKQLKVS